MLPASSLALAYRVLAVSAGTVASATKLPSRPTVALPTSPPAHAASRWTWTVAPGSALPRTRGVVEVREGDPGSTPARAGGAGGVRS